MYYVFHVLRTMNFHVSCTLHIVNIILQLRISLTSLTELLSSLPLIFSGQGKDPTIGLQEYKMDYRQTLWTDIKKCYCYT